MSLSPEFVCLLLSIPVDHFLPVSLVAYVSVSVNMSIISRLFMIMWVFNFLCASLLVCLSDHLSVYLSMTLQDAVHLK